MRVVCQALLSVAAIGLAACGNHSSSPAPIVYGAGDAHQARIYRSPDEIYRKQQIERNHGAVVAASTQPGQSRSAPASRQSVSLTPVSAVYLTDTVAAPVETQKIKGYIEVQPGDTVYAIARRFNVAPQDIISTNDLRAPYALRVGQALKLPKGAEALATPAKARKVVARDTLYKVRRGDTLYSISKAANVSVNAIAQANSLRQPYTISIGQQILIPQARTDSRIYAQSQTSASRPTRSKITNSTASAQDVGDIARSASYTARPAARPSSGNLFDWPVRGAVIASYGSGELGRRNDGVNIAAPAGTPVRAAAEGEVVYRGSELDGFGNLLLVKHVDGFVTAYAHNDAMLVKKGDKVRQGQVIAKVGDSGTVTSPQLHFEIRQNLKSIDPLSMLGSQ